MGVTRIYKIKVTGEKSLDYDTEDKVQKIVEVKNDSRDSLEYIMRDKKGNTYKLSDEYLKKMKDYISYEEDGNVVFHTLKTGLNCTAENAWEEWEQTRRIKKKEGGNLQYCIVQNFGIDLDPQIANEIGVAFANKYLSEYQCVVSTHINTGLVHNHIEFNATSFLTGKKFNDNRQAIGDIRKVSDELCRQYELDVLEKTKDFNYIIYKDEQGRTKIYEPTERKNQLRQGETSNKNDYINTEQYRFSKEHEEAHISVLKKDIDRFVPYAASYDELLELLLNAGYEIKDKTKTGEWRKHISFKAPGWEKFVRDSGLGEEYEREFLTNVIAENVKSGKVHEAGTKEKAGSDFKESDIYSYGRIIIEDINEDYRYRRRNGAYEKVKRNDVEKYIITDTKALNQNVNDAIKAAMRPERERVQEFVGGNKKAQYLIDRINSNLRTLHFVENKNIKSFEQISAIVGSLYEKRNACYRQLSLVGAALKKANENVALIDKCNNLRETLAANNENPDYVLYERDNDASVLKSLEKALKERGLQSREQQEQFKAKYKKYNGSFLQLSAALEQVNRDIREYDDCIFNISTVDKHNGNKYEKQIAAYYEEKQKQRSNKNKEQAKER